MTATESASDAPRYLTLRDYLRVLRRYWAAVLLVTAIGGAAGFATVARHTPVYKATAEVSFPDPNQSLNLAGFGFGSTETPGQVAAVNAQAVTGHAVMSEVKRRLKTPVSVDALTGAITAAVDTNSAVLLISATGSTSDFAARLANTTAGALVDQDNRETRARLAAMAADLRRHLLSSGQPGGVATPGTPLSYYQNELVRIQTLGSFATSAQIVKLAQTPAAPSSSPRSQAVLLGLGLGLLLGIVVAFVRDSMDRRLRGPQEVDSSFQLPLLGHIGKRSLGHVAYSLNGSGRNRGLELEQFRILRRNLELLDHDQALGSVLVTSAMPEEGKTTVATSLAFALASAGKRTLLVDCDLRRPAVARRLGISPSPGISEYLAGTADPEEILHTVPFTDPVDTPKGSTNGHAPAGAKLVCIPSGATTSRATELLASSRFGEFLEQVAETYDAVVLDSGPLLPVADTLEMLPHVHAVVICARESRTTRSQAQAARAVLRRFPERPAGVVVTGVKSRGAEDELYVYSYGYS